MIVQALREASSPWSQWGDKLLKDLGWPSDLLIERHNLQESSWAKVVDSFRSFTLFQQRKLLLLTSVEKNLPTAQDWERLFPIFDKGQHYAVLALSQPLKVAGLRQWKSPDFVEATSDKNVFRWIDALHASAATRALEALDAALLSGLYPLAILQILNRDLRLGRLIHYARSCKLADAEISTTLKAHPYVVQKWLTRKPLTNPQWARIFDRLLESDLDIKGSSDATWVLRRLSLDLNILLQGKVLATKAKTQAPITRQTFWQPTPLLWRASPSFA